MTFVVKDRVKEAIPSPGSGALYCGGAAPSGYQTIGSVMATGDIGLFCARDHRNNWQTFVGTWNATTNTLARTVDIDGSAGRGVTVTFAADTEVFMTYAASEHERYLNVLSFGAVGDGVTDDTVAVQLALAAVPTTGATVLFPPGQYLVNDHLYVKSNTTIDGSGTILSDVLANWAGGTPYQLLMNENHSASSITDENIRVRNITIDRRGDTVGSNGTRHCIYFRKARDILIENVRIYNGNSSVALLGCDNTEERGNWYIGFTNCGSDHWDSPGVTRVIGCYFYTTVAAQMANYNPDPTDSTSGETAVGFIFHGNTVVSTEDPTTPCQFEPLRATGTARDISVVGNTFINSYIVMRGDTANAIVALNTFSGQIGTASQSEIITSYPRNGGTPSNINIIGNVIRDPITSAGNVAAVRLNTDDGIIALNGIIGTSGLNGVSFGSTDTPVNFGNISSKLPTVGTQRQAWRMVNGSDYYVGWTDASGTVPRMFLQNDDNWIFQGTDSTGVSRVVASIYMRADASRWQFPPGADIGTESDNYFRLVGDSGTLGPALQAVGADTNIPLRLASKGTSPVVVTDVGLAFSSSTGASIKFGTGTPEAAVTAPVGSLFLRTDGGASTSLYVKESGSGNTGWVAK